MSKLSKMLQTLDVPTVNLEPHQLQIKHIVLEAGISANKTKWGVFMFKKKFMITAAMLAIAIVAGVGALAFSGQNAKAYADQSLQNFSKLTPVAQQSLDERVNGNAGDALKAAEEAKDLKILTYTQFQQLTQSIKAQTMSVRGGSSGNNQSVPVPETIDPTSLKYLSYTDTQGATHVIGVDKNGLPALIMVFNIGGNAGASTMQVQGRIGTYGVGTVTSGSGPAATIGQPMQNSCSQAVGGKVTCTSSESGTTTSNPNCQTLSNGAITCSASGTGEPTPPSN